MNPTLMIPQSFANMAAAFNQYEEEEEDFDLEYLLNKQSKKAQGKILGSDDDNTSNETNNVSRKDLFVDRHKSLYTYV